jgi:hypothetical protein
MTFDKAPDSEPLTAHDCRTIAWLMTFAADALEGKVVVNPAPIARQPYDISNGYERADQ